MPRESVAMSRHQHYEFAAMDGPISGEGLRYARSCSSRADVSRVRWPELNRLTYPQLQTPAGQTMKCTDLAAKAIATREKRQSDYARQSWLGSILEKE